MCVLFDDKNQVEKTVRGAKRSFSLPLTFVSQVELELLTVVVVAVAVVVQVTKKIERHTQFTSELTFGAVKSEQSSLMPIKFPRVKAKCVEYKG